MTKVNITRLVCDGCSHTVDAKDETYLQLEIKTPDEDGLAIKKIDLCAKCAGLLRRRLAEVGIQL